MPVKFESKQQEKKQVHITLKLDKDQRATLKELINQHKQLAKSSLKPVDINENLCITVGFDDGPYYFFYNTMDKNPARQLEIFIYDIFSIGEMKRKSKNASLSSAEEMLLSIWNRTIEYGWDDSEYRDVEPVAGELLRRAKEFYDHQLRLEAFFAEVSKGIEDGEELLDLIKQQDDIDEIIEALKKGETLQIW